MGRTYDNTRREQARRETGARILDEAERRIRRRPLAELTLNDVADGAGVSVQTVIRHFGGRDGLLEAVADRVGARIRAQRSDVAPGDVERAVDNVLEHYEAEGDLVLRVLSEEALSRFAAERAARGRTFHRDWVAHAFGPLLDEHVRSRQIDALIVATDLFTWRLLRRDHGRTLAETRAVVLGLVRDTLGVDE